MIKGSKTIKNKAASNQAAVENKPKQPPRFHWRRIAVAVAVVLFVALASLLWVVQVKKISFQNVVVAGVSAGRNLPDPSFTHKLQDKVADYHLQLTYPDGSTKSFSLNQVGVEADVNTTARAIIDTQQRASIWQRLAFWKTRHMPLELSVNEPVYNQFFSQEAVKANKPPVNANLSVSDGVVNETAATTGDGYIVSGGKNGLLATLATLPANPLALQAGTLEPSIQSKQLAAAKTKAETLLKQHVSFTINGKTITATPADIGSWVEFKPNDVNGTVAVDINGDKVLDYVAKISQPYTSFGSQIIFTQPDGTKVALTPGYQTLEGTNKTAVASALATQIGNGKDYQTTLAVQYTGAKTPNYSYDKWLAVDTTAKRMYAYEKTNLLKTFLISAGAPGTPTDKGFFKIYAKYRVQDMRGPNTDGTTYFQPNVEWVSYFYNGEAIHGNYWRPLSYFGNINSSHGCVGVVNSDAEWVYNWAPVGTPVVVYN